MSKVKITLTKSLIGRKSNQIATANSTTVQEANAVTEGKIRVISHLVTVEQEG